MLNYEIIKLLDNSHVSKAKVARQLRMNPDGFCKILRRRELTQSECASIERAVEHIISEGA